MENASELLVLGVQTGSAFVSMEDYETQDADQLADIWQQSVDQEHLG